MMSKCKIFVIMSILMGFSLCSSFAQKGKPVKPVDTTIISQENIPVEVAKAFKKRFAAATDVVWRMKEGNFMVECVLRNIPSEAVFQKDGTWLSTMEELDPNTLPPACLKSINAYFQKCTLASYKRKTENNKEITIIAGVYEVQNVKKKLETKILLDKLGTIIRTIEPEESGEEANAEAESASDKKKAKLEAKTQKEFDKDRRMDAHPIKISENELPSALLRWVYLRYPDYVYKEILYTEDDDFEDEGNLYRIKIQRSGVGQAAHSTLWFTRDGDFLKVDDPFRTEEELQKAEQASLAAEKEKEKEVKDSKRDTKTEQVNAEQEKTLIMVEEEEVSKEYITAFRLKYPRAKGVTWAEEEDNGWVAFFTDQAGKNEVSFEKTDSVKWLETKTPISDLERVPASIRSFVERNYPKQVSITQAWNVRSSKVKPYVIIVLYNKKVKISETLEFWQTGKPKE